MAQIPPFAPSAEIAQRKKEGDAHTKSRPGETSANPPSTNLPASVKLQSSTPPSAVPVMGKVPFTNPVDAPRVSEDARVVNNTPPTMSVNLREDFVNEASAGHQPLTPNLISNGAGQQAMTSGRPSDSDQRLSGANPVGSGPLITTSQPAVTLPIVAPGNDLE